MARVEGNSLNETVEQALIEAVAITAGEWTEARAADWLRPLRALKSVER